MAGPACNLCHRLQRSCTKRFVIRDIITEIVNDRSSRSQYIDDFLRYMNAFLNEGDGVLYIHCRNLHQLNLFDEQVDDKLRNLIVDNTPFAANFRRYIVDDEHIAFEVLHRPRQGLPYSILKFHTKVSLNRGLGDPTQMEMKYYVSDESCHGAAAATGGASSVVGSRQLTTRHGRNHRYDDLARLDKHPLQESISVQVKRVRKDVRTMSPENRGFTRQNWKNLLKFLWEETKLPLYISAFSKLDEGGSVYFGIKEDGQNGGKTGMVYYEGVQLSEPEKNLIREAFESRVQEKMMWLAHSAPHNPITVKFHRIERGDVPDLYVIEVVVSKLNGVAFFEEKGPKAYWLRGGTLSEIPVSDLVQKLGGSMTQFTPGFTRGVSQ